METVKKRIEWVDIGKFICIMFVMLSHLESGSDRLRALYTPFFLSTFFFLSGYVYREPGSFRELLGRKARGLLVPWFVFSNGSILLTMVTPFVDKSDIPQRFLWAYLQVRGFGDETWFVAALFVAFLPFYFLAKWKKRGLALGTACVLSLLSTLYTTYMPGELLPWGTPALPWHLEFMFQAAAWMLLGYDFRLYGESWFDKWKRGRLVPLWGLYLAVVYLPAGYYGHGAMIALSYIRSILGILAVTALCKCLKSNRYIRFVGANTLTYFALHGRAYVAIERLLAHFAGGFYEACLSGTLTSDLLAVAITVAVSVILMVPAEIINRWFPWVLGRKRVAK